ncbi:MAG: hypothetical protein KDA41_03230 [Planctomycetales bacterium]|nr:hypothetical protein [Planctomycetales bacterium]
MHPGRLSIPTCPQGEDFLGCNLRCKFHVFEGEHVQIYSWELKCLDCGYRSTSAVRSDDDDFDPASNSPRVCPFCALCATGKGINLCQTPS